MQQNDYDSSKKHSSKRFVQNNDAIILIHYDFAILVALSRFVVVITRRSH